MRTDFKRSYDDHVFLDFSERKSLIREHQEAKSKGDIDRMKLIEFALEDSEPETDAKLCAKGEYAKALEMVEKKEFLYRVCAQGTITITDLSMYENSDLSVKELQEQIGGKGRVRN